MLNELKENTHRQQGDIRKMVHEQKENINIEKKFKKSQTELKKKKKTVTNLKNLLYLIADLIKQKNQQT